VATPNINNDLKEYARHSYQRLSIVKKNKTLNSSIQQIRASVNFSHSKAILAEICNLAIMGQQ